jgi:hypothetical protein
MSERRTHRASLAVALLGTLLMLAAAVARIEPATDPSLPHYEAARPFLPDWPRHRMEPRA